MKYPRMFYIYYIYINNKNNRASNYNQNKKLQPET